MKLTKKLQKTHKYFASFFRKVINAAKQLHNQLGALWIVSLFILICVHMCSCGTTKITAEISQPKDGSNTTITISTNTPITTDVKPDANVNWQEK